MQKMKFSTFTAKMLGLTALICLPLMASASGIAQLRTFISGTQQAKGEFAQVQVQQEADNKMRMGTPSAGTFMFSKPGKFIWAYTKPYEQVIQSDGQMLYIYDKDLNQVTTRKLDNALGSSPAAILFGSTDIDRNFTLAENGTRDGMEWVEATPKDSESGFQRVKIGMKDNLPQAMELHDSLGQISLIKFTRFEKLSGTKTDAYRFVVPKGADVFKN